MSRSWPKINLINVFVNIDQHRTKTVFTQQVSGREEEIRI